ncbi:MAG: hypothetical protein Tsb009_15940 [Planctomycetaceae bacterium]
MKGSVGFGLKLWPILILAGAGMMVFAFFMPWWGVTATIPSRPERPDAKFNDPDYKEKMDEYSKELKKYREKQAKNSKAMKKYDDWYSAMKVDDKLKEAFEKKEDDLKEGKSVSATVRLWGWNTGTGLTNFIFGLIILPLAIVPMFVGVVRQWKFIGSYVAAILGLVGFILGLVFYFGSPGENTEFVAQGVGLSPGPYLVILGTLAVLVGGVFDGVFGTMALLKGMKKSRPAAESGSHDDELDDLDMDE